MEFYSVFETRSIRKCDKNMIYMKRIFLVHRSRVFWQFGKENFDSLKREILTV
jgi:hypothetical protein